MMLQDNKYAKNITDVSWSKFFRMLKYKAEWYGRVFLKIDRYFPSSQMCFDCKSINPAVKDLSVRTWVCPHCGAIHDRDYNAAKNIKAEGLRILNTLA